MRSEIERYNAKFKSMGHERMWVRFQNAVANLATISHIALLTVASAFVAHFFHNRISLISLIMYYCQLQGFQMKKSFGLPL